MIRSEHFHSKHPYRTYVGWALFYVALLLGAVYLFLTFANSLHSYDVPKGSVLLKVPYSKYLEGETVTFSVTNNYNATINIVNNCPGEPLAVYRKVDSDWKRVHATSKVSTCSEKLRSITVEPGKTVSGTYKNWPALFKRPGKYRIAVFIEYFGSVAYQDVTIVKKPKVASASTDKTVLPAPNSSSSTSAATPAYNDDVEGQQSAQPPTSSSQSATVPVGGKGTVVLSYTSTQITLVSVTPNTGCWYEGNKPGYIGTSIEITFKCGGETQLQAWLSNGSLRTKIEND